MIAPEIYAKETQLREIMQVQNMTTTYLEPFYSELQMSGHTAAKRQQSVAKSTAEQLGSILVNHSISTACTMARPRSTNPCHCAPDTHWVYFQASLLLVRINPVDKTASNKKLNAHKIR